MTFYSTIVRLASGELRWAGPLCLSREEAEAFASKKCRGEGSDGTGTPCATDGKEYYVAPFANPGQPIPRARLNRSQT
jgi:hypothetical protein